MTRLQFLDRAVFFFLCALIFVLPASVAGVSIFFVPALLCFLIKKILEFHSRPRGAAAADQALWPVFLPVGAFVLANLVSMFLSPYPELGLIAFRGKIMRAVFLFCMMVDTVRTEKRALTFLKVVLASAVILCLDGLWQLWTGHDVFKHLPMLDGRISGSFKHPNDLGGYLALVLPAVFVFALNTFRKSNAPARWPVRLFAAGSFLLLLTGLGLTYSRGAWLGFFAGMVFLMLSFRRLIWPALGAAVIFAVVFYPLLEEYRNVSFTSDDVAVTRERRTEVDVSAKDPVQRLWERGGLNGFEGNGRLAFWRDAVRIIEDHPVMGTGLNTYARVIRSYADVWKIYPHNSYLHMAAETGLAGLGAFLWLIVAVFWSFLAWLKRVREPLRGLWFSILAGFFGFLVHSFFDTALFSVQLGAVCWMTIGLLCARHNRVG